MTLTNNDKLFLQAVNRASRDGQTVVTNIQLLSKELLELFEVESNAQGFWCFNVYVELEPAFKTKVAEDWQKERPA